MSMYTSSASRFLQHVVLRASALDTSWPYWREGDSEPNESSPSSDVFPNSWKCTYLVTVVLATAMIESPA